MSRSKRRADGTLRPAVARHRARKRAAQRTEEQKAERRTWLDRFEPAARTRFFKHSRALKGEAIFLRAFSRELGMEQEEAAPMLERLANERGWMKLRTRDGMVVGISPPKNAKKEEPAAA